MSTKPDASTETFHLELKPLADPLRRQGINREPIYRLKRLLKIAGRECGFRVRWGAPLAEGTERTEHEGTMIRFTDGPAVKAHLMLKRAPLYLRVVFNALTQKWDALDQLADTPGAGEVVFVYRRVGEPGTAMIDWTEGGRRRGGCFASATYTLAAAQPDDVTARDTAKWQAWCWAQVGGKPQKAA